MSTILYYSNYCNNCKELLGKLGKTQPKEKIHYMCIDKRKRGNNGATYIILENSQEIILPPSITRVPALLLLNKGHQVLFGKDIYNYVQPLELDYTHSQTGRNNIDEPMAYSMCGGGDMYGITSDNFSFLDQTSDSLSAKGDGGMRQLYNYSTISNDQPIETPPDDYAPDKVNSQSYEQYQQQRNSDIP